MEVCPQESRLAFEGCEKGELVARLGFVEVQVNPPPTHLSDQGSDSF